MSTEGFLWLASLIQAHPDGKVVGRTRLQKEVKLLQRLGFPTSYGYKIHFYGPYSESLHSDVGLLEGFDLVEETVNQTQQGEAYYTMRAKPGHALPDVSQFKPTIEKLNGVDSVVLELAATYDSFRELGDDHEEALVRLRRKKGSKCDDGREERALTLLGELGLPHD